jgi:type IV secretion system protein VirD4
MDAMSRPIENQNWGPNHQQPEAAPARPHTLWRLLGWFVVATFVHTAVDNSGHGEIEWCIKAIVLGWLTRMLVKGIKDGQIPTRWAVPIGTRLGRWLMMGFAHKGPQRLGERVLAACTRAQRRRAEAPGYRPEHSPTAEDVRDHIAGLGGGAYLGLGEGGGWITAEAESAVMVLGPPRSGKTSAVMIPALLGSSGAAVSTSTKPDVIEATIGVRSRIGDVWLFDPAGKETLPEGVRRLSWSPVAAAGTWDQALVMAHAMTAATNVGRGTTNENHWTERAANLLAPMLYAANRTGRPIEEVLRWTLQNDLSPALQILAGSDAPIAADVLIGIQRTDARERSSIFSAAAGVLSAYNANAVRATAAEPNFDAHEFVASRGTIYITAPEQDQALCAPLIVGLLEQIRHAAYDHARAGASYPGDPMLWLLDEIANIAPIHDLPALVSQAGGQNLQVMIGLQDLSQARTRWGDAAAEGFMSLFQTRVVLDGIADPRTLESISISLGEYDRGLISTSTGTHERDEWLTPPNRSQGTSYQTHRQRTLTPGDIAKLPDEHALLLTGTEWHLLELTPWYERDPWASIAGR